MTFSYSQDRKVLTKFSAVFEEGKTTAIVGASGAGKSTIVQLLERFYDPTSGKVLFDGDDLRSMDLGYYRKHLVGYVGQEPVLFNCSIKENLLYARPEATDEEIESALRDANAWSFVEAMGGIETTVGNSGGQLSGG